MKKKRIMKNLLAIMTAAVTVIGTVGAEVAWAAESTTIDNEVAESLLGDANQDGKTNVVDTAFIAKYIAGGKVDELPACSDCNGDGKRDIRDAAILARALAMDYATKRGVEGNIKKILENQMTNEGQGNETLSLSSVEGLPGETVVLEVSVGCNDNFESADFTLGWDDKSLIADGASKANQNVACASNTGSDYSRIVSYFMSSDAVADDVIADIEFTIPADAVVGTVYNIDFSDVNTFAICDGPDIADSVTVTGGAITVVGESVDNPDNPDTPVYTGVPTLSLSSATGMPGDTVTLQVDAITNNNLEAAQFCISWDGDLKGSEPYSGYVMASDISDNVAQAVVLSGGGIPDGKIAQIDFTIPADAVEGTVYNVYFTEVPTFGGVDGSDLTSSLATVNGTIVVGEKPVLNLSGASGEPGETVSLEVLVECNNKFESLEAELTWDDENLILSSALGTDNTTVSLDGEKGNKLVVSGSKAVKDGVIAVVKFTIPEDAEPGTEYYISWGNIKNYSADGYDVSQNVDSWGTFITVNEPYVEPEYTYDEVDEDGDGEPDYVTITGLDENATKFKVPAEVNGLPVKSIAESACSYHSALETLVIPEGVTEIGDYAFSDCTNLRSVVFPESLTAIGEGAFYGWNSLSTVKIPAGVTSIGEDAFNNCGLIESFEVSEKNKNYCSVDGVLFNKNKTELVDYPFGKGDTEYVIPESVTAIGNHAFSDCIAMTSIDLPSKLKTIGDYAFSGCEGLTSIEIPDSVNTIGEYAFQDCTALTDIVIPDSITFISDFAFSGTGLTSVVLPDSVTEIGYGAFSHCEDLTDVVIPDSVTTIGVGAFEDCTSLTNIEIPSGVTVISGAAFNGTGLTSVVIPDGVTMIGDNAFSQCENLVSVEIPASVEVIGASYLIDNIMDPWWGFYGCSSLKEINVDPENKVICSIDGVVFNKDQTELLLYPMGKSQTKYTVPDSVTTIGGNAFDEAVNLKSVVIPEGVTSIEDSAFSDCTNLANVEIPDSVTSIGMNAFSGTALKENETGIIYIGNWAVDYVRDDSDDDIETVDVKDGTIGIAKGALSNCTGTVNIPASVKYIPANPSITWGNPDSLTINIAEDNENFCCVDGVLFNKDKTRLIAYPNSKTAKKYVIPDGVETIGEYAFVGCYNLTTVIIPDSVRDIEKCAFNECQNLTNVVIPDGVETIGDGAFEWCFNLGDMELPASVKSIGANIFEYSGIGNLTVLNPECKFPEGPISNSGELMVILGYDNSTAMEYAKKYGYTNESLGNAPEITTATTATTTTTTTTAATTASTPSKTTAETTAETEATTDATTPATEATTEATTPTATAATEGHVKGDANNDGKLSIRDAAAIAILCAKGQHSDIPEWADYNGDGIRNIRDAAAIAIYCAKRSAGLITDEETTTTTIKPIITTTTTVVTTTAATTKATTTATTTGTTAVYENLSYRYLSDGSIEIASGDESAAEIVIPETINGDPVTKIGKQAFYKYSKLENVTIPDSVTEIGEKAFYDTPLTSLELPKNLVNIGDFAFYACQQIKSVDIPDGVKTIGEDAFDFCRNLESIHIPESVTTIGNKAFFECTFLKEITIPSGVTNLGAGTFDRCRKLDNIYIAEGNESYTDIDGVVFSKDRKTLIKFPTGRETYYTVPDGVTTIARSAFNDSEITGIEFPDGLTTIDTFAFQDCESIRKINIPDSVTTINGSAFEECDNLEEVHLGNGITKIDFATFRNCTGLKNIVIPDSVTSVDGFTGCYYLENVTLGKNVQHIEGTAFSECSSLKELNLPDSVTTIESGAFHGCSSLTDVIIPDGITDIGGSLFKDCLNLRSVTIPQSVTTIGGNAFRNCSNLEKITIPESVTSIGDYAFYNCRKLSNINIPKGVEYIRNGVFSNCTDLKSFTIPSNITQIGKEAFSGCIGLKNVTIPDSVKYIGDSAFFGCVNLGNTKTPSGALIGKKAFMNYTSTPKYSYELYALSEVGSTIYNSTTTLFIKTDNPDPDNFFIISALSFNYDFIEVNYADVKLKNENDKHNFKAVDGGYIWKFDLGYSGDYDFIIAEYTSDANTIAIASKYKLNVKDYGEAYDAWMDDIIAKSTTEDMTNFEKMSAVSHYLISKFSYVTVTSEDGKNFHYCTLAAEPNYPYFESYRWNSYTSPAGLCAFARRIGGFDKIINLYARYPEFGYRWENGHYLCYCSVGDESHTYQACPTSPTGDVTGYKMIDFTDPSQLYQIKGLTPVKD